MKLSEVDQILIRYADTESPTAISFRLGGEYTPQWCAQRIQALLDTPDWLTAAQQDQLVTQKMRLIIVQLEGMQMTARLGEVILMALERLGNRLDKRSSATEQDLRKLYAFQGTVLLDSVEKAMDYMRKRLTKADPQAELEWDQAKEAAIRFAAAEISKHEEGYEEEPVYVPQEPTERQQATPPLELEVIS